MCTYALPNLPLSLRLARTLYGQERVSILHGVVVLGDAFALIEGDDLKAYGVHIEDTHFKAF